MRPVPNHTIRDGHDTSFNLTPPEQFVPNTMKLAVNARLKRFDIFIIVGVDSDFNLFIPFEAIRFLPPLNHQGNGKKLLQGILSARF